MDDQNWRTMMSENVYPFGWKDEPTLNVFPYNWDDPEACSYPDGRG